MATRARGQKSRQQVEMEMKWNRGGGESLVDIVIDFFQLKCFLPFSKQSPSHAVTRTLTHTHLIRTHHIEHRTILFRPCCSLALDTHGPRTLFICYVTCFVGNNYSSGGLFIAGRVLGRYSGTLCDCLITESHVSYHSVLWWDLRHGCLVFVYSSAPSLTMPSD